jgi:hypothetical protein
MTGGNNKDVFVFQSASGDDHITDFAKHDKIQFDGVAGINDFSDLTLVAVGPNVSSPGAQRDLTRRTSLSLCRRFHLQEGAGPARL